MSSIVSSNHPAMAGHFPGNPIVPGATILSYLVDHAATAGFELQGIKRCKFLQLLKPGQPFEIALDAVTGKFTISAATGEEVRIIARGIANIGEANGS